MNQPVYERRDWSRAEVEATVAAYFEMLLLELRDLPYNKAERRRQLLALLDRRTEGAIERKHQNISAILLDLDLPYIEGYKPLRNYQDLLFEAVEDRVFREPQVETIVEEQVRAPAAVPSVDDILNRLVEKPDPLEKRRAPQVRERPPRRPKTNYLLMEAANTALGTAGELFVINFEIAGLLAARKDRLAARVEHTALVRGDGEGYDVLSFEPGGKERLIEVKTTNYGAYTPFYISSNELQVSKRRGESYLVSRVFDFRRNPRLFFLPGDVSNSCSLEASQYIGRIA